MGKKCDLCNGVARMYCESDQASLCWNCDGLVHGANFLVAKHTRCLLCTTCHSLTPWTASGLRLRPTFSVCHSCVALKKADRIPEEVDGSASEEDRLVEDGAESYDEDEEYSGDDDEEDDVDEEEEAENQVVPWSTAAQPSTVMSSSCSDGVNGNLATKRARDYSDDKIGSSSTQEPTYSRPLKRTLRNETAV